MTLPGVRGEAPGDEPGPGTHIHHVVVGTERGMLGQRVDDIGAVEVLVHLVPLARDLLEEFLDLRAVHD
ncbi:MAG: hypothetical protein WKF47_17030 [Geodermatophilaceae bacterium]